MAISEIDEVLRRYRAAISRIGILRAFTRATISALRFTRSILPRPYSGLGPRLEVLFTLGREWRHGPFPAARMPGLMAPH